MDKGNLMWLAVAVALGLALVFLIRGQDGPQISASQIKVPALSAEAEVGRAVFEANCITCHGKNAAGSANGPPLIHKIYEPGHHSDQSFYRAAKFGVTAHHWPYGNMPPVSGVKAEDVTEIIRYVRELQRANGIF